MSKKQNFAIFILLVVLNSGKSINSHEIRPFQPKNFFSAISQIHHDLNQTGQINTRQLYKNAYSNNLNYEMFVYKALTQVVSLPTPNVSANCFQQVEILVNGITHYQPWALQVIDALGKPPSGILQGSFNWLGEFSECKNATFQDWKGKYCIVSKPAPSTEFAGSVALKVGVCVPNQCDNNDIANLINFAMELLPKNVTHLLPFNLTAIDSSYITCDEPKELTSDAIAAIVVFSIIFSLVAAGTLHDLYQVAKNWYLDRIKTHEISMLINESLSNNQKVEPLETQSTIVKILHSFSLYTNTLKLFKITKNEDQLDCLHSLRFLSIAWVILGHTYVFTLSFADNPAILPKWLDRLSFMFVANAFFSVDNFFLFSGLLTSYLFLKETSKNKLTPGLMVKYYLHRLWRITPTYGLVIFFSYSLTAYLGNGPLYPKIGFEAPTCSQYWWTNLLYVNNFGNYSIESCLPVGWYLANDMQFHWIAPIILIPMAIGMQGVSFLITAVFTIAHIITTALIINAHPGTEVGLFSSSTSMDYFTKIYVAPWCRIGPFLVGIIYGYIIYQQKKKNFKLSLVQNLICWLLSIVSLLILLFITHPNLNGHTLPKWFNIIYSATSRTLWAIALGFVIFACSSFSGGFVNKILSLPVWIPLSRVSFAIYLIHSTVIVLFNSTLERPFHLQDTTIIYTFVAHLVWSIFGGYLVSMTLEVPIIALEKILLKHK